MTRFEPYADDATTVSAGGLIVENGTEAVVVHGSVEIARDRAGLENARALAQALQAVVRALEAADLPDRAAEAPSDPGGEIANPFG